MTKSVNINVHKKSLPHIQPARKTKRPRFEKRGFKFNDRTKPANISAAVFGMGNENRFDQPPKPKRLKRLPQAVAQLSNFDSDAVIIIKRIKNNV